MNVSPKQLLGQLIKNAVISKEEADKIELNSLQKNISVYQYLITYSQIKKLEVLKAVAEILKVAYIDLMNSPVDPEAISYVSESIARKYGVIPYKFNVQENSVYLATSDPFNTSVQDFLEKKTGKKIVMTFADSEEIEKTINLSYSQGLSPEVTEALKDYEPEKQDQAQVQTSVIKEAPIAKIVSTILEFAIKGRASDIHIEPQENRTQVRYRIDGVLQEKLSLPRSIHDSLVSRIKILAQMKIDERRVPQDGRFNFKLGANEVDLRVSSLPTVHGEKVVMRLLKKTGGIPTLNELGLRGPQLKDLEEAILKPYGIILVTGPTGSGKTTTLYSVLNRLNKPTVNIVTLEDPVEYQMVGINQVQINPQAGLTFATGLRSFLRQDPNIILVGEIRDKETTQLAIQAALTGHLVFSTLHTNDSATSIPRLIDLGGEPFLISSVLSVSMAQRIIRRVCKSCAVQYEPEQLIKEDIKKILGTLLPKKYVEGKPILLTKGKGCKECNQTGYKGRVAIFEVLKISPAINRMILESASGKDIENQAKKEGMILMKQDGYLKVLEGITTIEEILRVAEI